MKKIRINKISDKKYKEFNDLVNLLIENGAGIYLTDNNTTLYFYPHNEDGWSLRFNINGTWKIE